MTVYYLQSGLVEFLTSRMRIVIIVLVLIGGWKASSKIIQCTYRHSVLQSEFACSFSPYHLNKCIIYEWKNQYHGRIQSRDSANHKQARHGKKSITNSLPFFFFFSSFLLLPNSSLKESHSKLTHRVLNSLSYALGESPRTPCPNNLFPFGGIIIWSTCQAMRKRAAIKAV